MLPKAGGGLVSALVAVNVLLGLAPVVLVDTLDALREATRQLGSSWLTPGQGCAGLLAPVARYVRLCVLVAAVGWAAPWWVAIVLLATVLVFRHGQVSGHRRYSRVWRRLAAGERRSEYLRNLAIRPGAGKEIRIFGLVDWLADRYEDSYRGWLAGIWRERRRLYLWPFLWFTAFGLVMAAAVFVILSPNNHHRSGQPDRSGADPPGSRVRAAARGALPRG